MRPMRFLILIVVALALASDPDIAFTTRNPFDCPVSISSFAQSKVYGFESVRLKNDGDASVAAVELTVTLRTDSGDEVAEERRVAAELQPHDAKSVIADLGHVQGLGQKVQSARQQKGMAILTVKLVEFADGSIWQPKEPVQGIPELPPPSSKRK
jgi:hypothetical protein